MHLERTLALIERLADIARTLALCTPHADLAKKATDVIDSVEGQLTDEVCGRTEEIRPTPPDLKAYLERSAAKGFTSTHFRPSKPEEAK